MKKFVPVAFATILLVAASSVPAQLTNQGHVPPDAIQSGGPAAAQAAADVWLALLDDAEYLRCYQMTAGIFQRAVAQDKWMNLATTHRTPMGKLVSRKLQSATFTTALPGAPYGKYVVLQYDSAFEHKKSARESATAALDTDGQWKVSGYYVR